MKSENSANFHFVQVIFVKNGLAKNKTEAIIHRLSHAAIVVAGSSLTNTLGIGTLVSLIVLSIRLTALRNRYYFIFIKPPCLKQRGNGCFDTVSIENNSQTVDCSAACHIQQSSRSVKYCFFSFRLIFQISL